MMTNSVLAREHRKVFQYVKKWKAKRSYPGSVTCPGCDCQLLGPHVVVVAMPWCTLEVGMSLFCLKCNEELLQDVPLVQSPYGDD